MPSFPSSLDAGARVIRRIGFVLGFAGLSAAGAAIQVSGVSHRQVAAAGTTATVSVATEAGYEITALLDDQPLALDQPVTVAGTGYHEVVQVRTPTGGGAAETSVFQFIIRAAGRGSTEDGIPVFTPYPVVEDAPSAFEGLDLELVVPSSFPAGMALPVAARLVDGDGEVVWLNGTAVDRSATASSLRVLRGWGSAVLPPADPADGTRNWSLDLNGIVRQRWIAVEDAPGWVVKGGTLNGNEEWPDGARIDLTSTLVLAPGATLSVGQGAVVRIGEGVGIEVSEGATMNVAGTVANPAIFTAARPDQPWGGIWLRADTGGTPGVARLSATGAIFAAYGRQHDWFSTHSGYNSHRKEEACVLVDTNAELDLTDCFLVDGRGQAFHGKGGTFRLTRSLVHRATTGGEINAGAVAIDRCGFIEFFDRPNGSSNVFLNASPGFVDGDNDGLYLVPGVDGGTGQPRLHDLERTVIGWTIDDGIDTGGGGGGRTVARDCWFESCFHEAMSHSGSGRIPESRGSVHFANGQAFECGYDGPDSFMEGCAVIGNMVGARFGDNYDWSYPGSLTVQDSLLLYNEFHDVWGYEWDSWSYRFADMTIRRNRISKPADLGRHPGPGGEPADANAAWDPARDGALLAPFMPVAGSDVGVAIIDRPAGGALADYPVDGRFRVRLSTFSAKPVSVRWTVMQNMELEGGAGGEAASGVLEFLPGETLREIVAPLPGNGARPAVVRLALDAPVNAAVTGSDAWFFDQGEPPGDEVLIAFGADGWSYSAIRAEPAGGWRGLVYDESPGEWSTGVRAPIGFGNIGASGSYLGLGTVLTADEAGPSGDRTRAVYLRRAFSVAEPADIRSMSLRLIRDDGAVVYLNGVEVARSNIDSGSTPGGIISYDTLASSTIDGAAEREVQEIEIPVSALQALVPGTNVLAVEVHQVAASSSDLACDAELVASFAGENRGAIGIGRLGDDIFVRWDDASQELQESDDLRDWRPCPDQSSPVVIDPAASRRFYRGVPR